MPEEIVQRPTTIPGAAKNVPQPVEARPQEPAAPRSSAKSILEKQRAKRQARKAPAAAKPIVTDVKEGNNA